MGGTTFGAGFPYTYPTSQLSSFGVPTYGAHAFGGNPFLSQQQQSLQQPLQQILQVLQIVPQQLQQVLQAIPAQLAQLHQLIQLVPQHIHQMQQPSQVQQPFGQIPGVGGITATPQWGISPQIFGAQPGYVM